MRGYYSVPAVLDVDRYEIDGKERDMVVAAREMNLDGLPDAQKKWANEKTVYTHGYGLIAAYGNQRNADDQPVGNDGEPVFAEEDLPPRGEISDIQPDGKLPRRRSTSARTARLLHRRQGRRAARTSSSTSRRAAATPGQSRPTTYDGKDGVGVGNIFRKLLYAVKFGDANIVLSSRVNENSKILYDRSPRERVQKVAPVADRRLRRAAGRGRRQDRLDPRRLHHQRQVPPGGEEVAARR